MDSTRMSLPKLCLTRDLFPKRPLGKRFPFLQGENILARKQKPRVVGMEKSFVYSSNYVNISVWQALFLELEIQKELRRIPP